MAQGGNTNTLTIAERNEMYFSQNQVITAEQPATDFACICASIVRFIEESHQWRNVLHTELTFDVYSDGNEWMIQVSFEIALFPDRNFSEFISIHQTKAERLEVIEGFIEQVKDRHASAVTIYETAMNSQYEYESTLSDKGLQPFK